jgi:hypothetical protein
MSVHNAYTRGSFTTTVTRYEALGNGILIRQVSSKRPEFADEIMLTAEEWAAIVKDFAPAPEPESPEHLPLDSFTGERRNISLVDDLVDVLIRMTIGWEYVIGHDLAQHPDIVRVLARYRAQR